MLTNPKLVMTDVPDDEARVWILEGLAAENRAHVHEPGLRHLTILIKHSWTGRLLGGLVGRTAWDWLLIELLYVSRELRGGRWGEQLLRAAEEEAIRRHCFAAWVEPFSFQAFGFYERMGYSIFGTLDDYPAGHKRLFLKKKLADRTNPLSSVTGRL